MPHRPSRRDLICETALDLAAEGGNHALTHQAIDTRLGLARGSTSYYYRTRRALVSAAIAHLTTRSRDHFRDAVPAGPPATPDEAAGLIADQLEILLVDRRRDVLARYALVVDAAGEDELRSGLASCLFSHVEAIRLMGALGTSDPEAAAHDLISLLEGLVFDHTYGIRALGTRTSHTGRHELLRIAVRRWIDALVVGR